MNSNSLSCQPAEEGHPWLLRAGGLAALAIGIAYIGIMLLYAQVGSPPVGGHAWLEYLSGKTILWQSIVYISILTNFLFVPVAMALYIALHRTNPSAMLIATAFMGLFVLLELAVNWSCYTALISLSQDYALASGEAQRAMVIAAANVPAAILASRLALIYAIGTLSFGFLISSWVMLRSPFNKITAYIGLATGLLGLLAVAGVSLAVILNAVGATLWLLLLGPSLYRFRIHSTARGR